MRESVKEMVKVARSGGSVYCLGKFTSQKGFSHQMFWQLAAAFFFSGAHPFLRSCRKVLK